MSEAPTPPRGQETPIRWCFVDERLSAVALLDERGACETPPAHWTTTRAPVDLSEVHMGMSMTAFCALRGDAWAIALQARAETPPHYGDLDPLIHAPSPRLLKPR